MCGGGGSNTRLKKCKISLVSIFLFSVSFGVADSYLDERLQKLEKQRQNLEAKIQKEAQNKEIKAQKQAKAKEEKQRKERQAQEKREVKQAQKRELRQTKRQQREFYKDESAALLDGINTSQESRRLRHAQSQQPSIYTNPNDRNGWFIALTPKVEVIFIYADISTTRYNAYLFNAGYGSTLEAGYLFGSGANRWRTYFSLGYGYGRSSDIAYRYDYYGDYYGGYNTEVIVDIHNITHNVGIDWIPRLGSSSARGVLGFSNSFSYIAMSERYEKYNLSRQCVPNGDLWGWNYCMIGGTQGSWQTTPIPAGETQDFIHIFFIGVGTRLGVIFDIKEHFSIEIGSRLGLHFSILHSINNGGLEFVAGVMPSFEQYLSLAYRF